MIWFVLENNRSIGLGTGPYVLVFDLTTNQQILQRKILNDGVVHGFDARMNGKFSFLRLSMFDF